jgi:predicted acylesterase/phospholipase RssA
VDAIPASPLPRPFGRIALSLSGGGYRAAAFHLGAMDLLQRLDLLRDVTTLSTVSGGTFTGVRYAVSLKAGQPFRTFYDELKNDFETIHLPTLALAKLTSSAPSIPSGRWDVITAFAQVYDEKLFAGKKFGVFWEGPAIPLTELIFNSTEFRTAVAFRFRKSENPKSKIGNGNVFITADQARQIRLADVVAASSCFPGGFEPLSFPNDFQWADDAAGRTALQELQAQPWSPLPLMDGGVYDNQGIGSLILGSNIPADNFGLFIISDTDPQQSALYSLPKPRAEGWLRLWHLNVLWWLLLALCGVSAVVSVKLVTPQWYQWPAMLNLIPLGMAVGMGAALLWLRSKITEAFRAVPTLGLAMWSYLKPIKINHFIDMIEVRIASLFALAANVFMRRIRRLVYDSLFADPRFEKKIVPNLIYDLLEERKYPDTRAWLVPSAAMRKVAAAAEAMPTTLWFTDPQQMKDLIACGQMTMCSKLLIQIAALGSKDGTTVPANLQATFDMAQGLYMRLKEDPYCLVSAP